MELRLAHMHSPAIGIVNERREFTFMEIINRVFSNHRETTDHPSSRTRSLRRNDGAVGASRQQAILHLAGRGQIVRCHGPIASMTTAMTSPAIAPRRLPPWSGSFMARSIHEPDGSGAIPGPGI